MASYRVRPERTARSEGEDGAGQHIAIFYSSPLSGGEAVRSDQKKWSESFEPGNMQNMHAMLKYATYYGMHTAPFDPIMVRMAHLNDSEFYAHMCYLHAKLVPIEEDLDTFGSFVDPCAKFTMEVGATYGGEGDESVASLRKRMQRAKHVLILGPITDRVKDDVTAKLSKTNVDYVFHVQAESGASDKYAEGLLEGKKISVIRDRKGELQLLLDRKVCSQIPQDALQEILPKDGEVLEESTIKTVGDNALMITRGKSFESFLLNDTDTIQHLKVCARALTFAKDQEELLGVKGAGNLFENQFNYASAFANSRDLRAAFGARATCLAMAFKGGAERVALVAAYKEGLAHYRPGRPFREPKEGSMPVLLERILEGVRGALVSREENLSMYRCWALESIYQDITDRDNGESLDLVAALYHYLSARVPVILSHEAQQTYAVNKVLDVTRKAARGELKEKPLPFGEGDYGGAFVPVYGRLPICAPKCGITATFEGMDKTVSEGGKRLAMWLSEGYGGKYKAVTEESQDLSEARYVTDVSAFVKVMTPYCADVLEFECASVDGLTCGRYQGNVAKNLCSNPLPEQIRANVHVMYEMARLGPERVQICSDHWILEKHRERKECRWEVSLPKVGQASHEDVLVPVMDRRFRAQGVEKCMETFPSWVNTTGWETTKTYLDSCALTAKYEWKLKFEGEKLGTLLRTAYLPYLRLCAKGEGFLTKKVDGTDVILAHGALPPPDESLQAFTSTLESLCMQGLKEVERRVAGDRNIPAPPAERPSTLNGGAMTKLNGAINWGLSREEHVLRVLVESATAAAPIVCTAAVAAEDRVKLKDRLKRKRDAEDSQSGNEATIKAVRRACELNYDLSPINARQADMTDAWKVEDFGKLAGVVGHTPVGLMPVCLCSTAGLVLNVDTTYAAGPHKAEDRPSMRVHCSVPPSGGSSPWSVQVTWPETVRPEINFNAYPWLEKDGNAWVRKTWPEILSGPEGEELHHRNYELVMSEAVLDDVAKDGLPTVAGVNPGTIAAAIHFGLTDKEWLGRCTWQAYAAAMCYGEAAASLAAACAALFAAVWGKEGRLQPADSELSKHVSAAFRRGESILQAWPGIPPFACYFEKLQKWPKQEGRMLPRTQQVAGILRGVEIIKWGTLDEVEKAALHKANEIAVEYVRTTKGPVPVGHLRRTGECWAVWLQISGPFRDPVYYAVPRDSVHSYELTSASSPLPPKNTNFWVVSDVEGDLRWLEESHPDDGEKTPCHFLGDTWGRSNYENAQTGVETDQLIYQFVEQSDVKRPGSIRVPGNRDLNIVAVQEEKDQPVAMCVDGREGHSNLLLATERVQGAPVTHSSPSEGHSEWEAYDEGQKEYMSDAPVTHSSPSEGHSEWEGYDEGQKQYMRDALHGFEF